MEDTEVGPVDFENQRRKKIAKSLTSKNYTNTPKSTKNYLTLEEKLEMSAILDKEDTEAEEDSSVEIEKIQDCLSNDLGSDPNFIAKSGSDSATDEESDQASYEKLKKIQNQYLVKKFGKIYSRYSRKLFVLTCYQLESSAFVMLFTEISVVCVTEISVVRLQKFL